MRIGIRKRCIYAAFLCMGMNLLAGCKEKTVDYSVENETENTQEESGGNGSIGRGKKGLKQFADEPAFDNLADAEGWRGENAKGEEVGVTVYDAEVTVPDAEEMYVVEVKEPEFNAAYKKQLAEKIFGDAEVYYNDLAHLPRKDIEERRKECQYFYQIAKANEKIYYDTVKFRTRQYQFDPEKPEGWKDILEQELIRYDNALETAGDKLTAVSEYDADEYLGTYSGMTYELSFSENDKVRKRDDGPYVNAYSEDGFFMNCRGKEISLQVKDIYQVCPEEVKEVEGLFYRDLKDFSLSFAEKKNQCRLSEEVCKKLAKKFVDELNLGDYVYTNCANLNWWRGAAANFNDSGYVTDGYIFYFEAGIDSVSFVQFGTQENDWNYLKLKKEQEEPQYCLKARIEVYVNDKGVIGMRAYHPIETVSVSEGVDLLPLDAVKGIIKDQLENHFADFRFKVDKFEGNKFIQFQRLELIYFRVRNKENGGYYSYIPVWRLSGGFDYPRYFENPLLINAIDGSAINFYDEA